MGCQCSETPASVKIIKVGEVGRFRRWFMKLRHGG